MSTNKIFEFNHHTRICFGAGMVKETGAEVSAFGKRALVVSDKGIENTGIVEKVLESLSESGVEFCHFNDVTPNPREAGVEAAAELGREFNADVVVGIGGGSAMDTAKAANVLISNGEDCEYWKWEANNSFYRDPLPTICVPTTSGTGSEITYEAVITSAANHVKISLSDGPVLQPKVAIMDPELTITVPPLVTASTGMDALTHALEAYTCTYSTPICDALAMYAMRAISGSIVEATKNGTNIEARTDMMLGSLMGGMAFANSFLGAVHSLSERIGGFYDTPHGIANSIFLPWVTQYNISADYAKHAVVAECLGIDRYGLTDKEASEKAVEKLFAMNKELGIPTFKEVKNVNPADFDMIADSCVTHACTEANPRDIDKAGFIKILQDAYDYSY